MRDDLHKGAPVPKAWKSLIRVSARDADWGTSGPHFAQNAIATLANQFNESIVRSLRQFVASDQFSLDPARELDTLRLSSNVPPILSVVFDELKYALRQGLPLGEEALGAAIRSALDEGINHYLRATTRHVDKKAPGCTPQLVNRMKHLLRSAPLEEVATSIAHGKRLPPPPAKRPIDPEEGLPLGV